MTNVPQELVRLDKKGEVILSDGRFVTIHKIKVGHLLASHNGSSSDLESAIKLITVTTKIDDVSPSVHDVLNLEREDFHKIMEALNK